MVAVSSGGGNVTIGHTLCEKPFSLEIVSMDKLSMAIIAMEAHVACSNDRLRQAWNIIHAKLVEENGSSHNKQSTPLCSCGVEASFWSCDKCFDQYIPHP